MKKTYKKHSERVEYLALLTKRDYVLGYWNGLVHVYNKLTGEMLGRFIVESSEVISKSDLEYPDKKKLILRMWKETNVLYVL